MRSIRPNKQTVCSKLVQINKLYKNFITFTIQITIYSLNKIVENVNKFVGYFTKVGTLICTSLLSNLLCVWPFSDECKFPLYYQQGKVQISSFRANRGGVETWDLHKPPSLFAALVIPWSHGLTLNVGGLPSAGARASAVVLVLLQFDLLPLTENTLIYKIIFFLLKTKKKNFLEG